MVNVMKNHTSPKAVAFSEQTKDHQVKNHDGGMVFKVDDVDALTRFLVLGSEGGTYYASERALTRDAAKNISKMIKSDEEMVLSTVVDVSSNNRAPKNTYALYVMALLMTEGENKVATREALPQVARTATHLMEFVSYLNDLGGMGSAKRKTIANWYTSKTAADVAYQVIKYRSRHGFTHRDLFRISHPEGVDKAVGEFILRGTVSDDVPDIIKGYDKARNVKTGAEAVKVLKEFPNLPWEAFPTEVHKNKAFWSTLFYNGMGATALVRNISRFARLGMFENMTFTGDVAKAIKDEKNIKKGRMHPVQYLNAWSVLKYGKFETGEYSWYAYRTQPEKVPSQILRSLEKAFFASFGNVESSGKRTMISLDVSGSMGVASNGGLVGLSCMQAAGAMALVTASVEDYVVVNAFSSTLTELDVAGSQNIEDLFNKMDRLHFGSTNISLPISQALQSKTKIDTFIVYTDSEVNTGLNVDSVLAEYRRKVNPGARLVVVAAALNDFTVGDPKDKGILNVAGFDASAPKVISDFSAGRL